MEKRQLVDAKRVSLQNRAQRVVINFQKPFRAKRLARITVNNL